MTLEIIREIGKGAFVDGLEILQLTEIIQKQNTGRINGNMIQAGASRAAHAVRNSLTTRLVILTSGSFSRPRYGDDRHLAKGIQLLEQPEVSAKLIETGTAQETIDAALKLWLHVSSEPSQATLSRFRNKFTAHRTAAVVGLDDLKWEEMFEFSIRTAAALEAFSHAAGVTGELHQEHLADVRSAAQEFWRPWLWASAAPAVME